MPREADVLDMLDAGESLSPPGRALLLARLGGAADDPASLPLGSRDRLILQLRAQLLGDVIEAVDVCPHCHEQTSFELSCASMTESAAHQPEPITVHCDDFTVVCRPLTGRDLLAAAHAGPDGTRGRLIAATVLEARRGAEMVDALALPQVVVDEIARLLVEADPLADVVLSLSCPACHGVWDTSLDIGEFVWRELRDWGRRVLREVHTLARAYGWREPDVLAIPPSRRRVYLEWAANG
jgi:hypothetical protein